MEFVIILLVCLVCGFFGGQLIGIGLYTFVGWILERMR